MLRLKQARNQDSALGYQLPVFSSQEEEEAGCWLLTERRMDVMRPLMIFPVSEVNPNSFSACALSMYCSIVAMCSWVSTSSSEPYDISRKRVNSLAARL